MQSPLSKVARARAAAEFGGLLFERLDLLVAVSLVVVLQAFVNLLLFILQHAIDQSSEPVGPGSDGFRGAELAAQSAVLR